MPAPKKESQSHDTPATPNSPAKNRGTILIEWAKQTAKYERRTSSKMSERKRIKEKEKKQ